MCMHLDIKQRQDPWEGGTARLFYQEQEWDPQIIWGYKLCLEQLRKHRWPSDSSFSALEILRQLSVHNGWNSPCSFENKWDPACDHMVGTGHQKGQLPQAGLRIPSACSLHLNYDQYRQLLRLQSCFSVLFYPGNVHLLPTHLWDTPCLPRWAGASRRCSPTELGNYLQSLRLLEDRTTPEDQSEKIHGECSNMLYLWQR